MLMKTLHDLVFFLMLLNGGVALFTFIAAARHQTLIIWDWMEEPDWRLFLSGRIFSHRLPEKFRSRRRQLVTLFFAFFATLAVQAFLIWLYNLVSPNLTAC